MKCSIFLACVLCVTPAMCQSLENVHSRIAALKAGDKVKNWTVRRVVLMKRIKGSSPVGFYDEVDFVGQATVTGEVANDQTMNSAGPIWNIYIDASTLAKLPTLGPMKSTGSAAVNRNNGFVSAGHIYLRNGKFAHQALQPMFENHDPTATIVIRNLSEAFSGGYAPPALEADFVRVVRR